MAQTRAAGKLAATLFRRALKYMLDNESMGIRDYEKMCRGVNRKTLQRDLKEMIEKGIVVTEGKTSSLVYLVKG